MTGMRQEGEAAGAARPLGRRIAKALGLLVVALIVLYVLFFHVFPWVERNVSNPSLDALPAESTAQA